MKIAPAFEVGVLEDSGNCSLSQFIAYVYYDDGAWYYDGFEGEDVQISKTLAMMMIEEMSEPDVKSHLISFLEELGE